MNGERFAQLRDIKTTIEGNNGKDYDRFVIETSIIDYNLKTLNKNQELIKAIEKYIEEFMGGDKFSMDYFNSLLKKLELYKGIQLQTSIPLHLMIYNLICNVVLLPNYLNDGNFEKNYNEIKKIINTYLSNFEKKIELMLKDDYCLDLGSISSLIGEMGSNVKKGTNPINDRSFYIGSGFGNNLFYFDENQGGYIMKVPINLGYKRNNKRRALKQIEIKDFAEIITKEYHQNFGDLTNYKIIVFEEENTGNVYHSESPTNGKFATISFGKMGSFINTDAIFKYLHEMLLFNNYLVNKLSKHFGIPIEKKVKLFSTGETLDVTKPTKDGNGKIAEVVENVSQSVNNQTSSGLDYESYKISNKTPVSLNDVGGLDDAKEEIEKIMDMIKRENFYRRFGARLPQGILFEGPKGTGKTLLARVIATEIDAEIYDIKATDIQQSSYINTGALAIKGLFSFLKEKTSNSSKKIIVILDEMDSLFRKRGGGNNSGEDTKVVNAFLAELNGMEDYTKNVIFIGTTNLVENIDEAILRSGRFDSKVKVKLPDENALKDIYRIHINKIDSDGKKLFDDISIELMAKKTVGLSGADVENIINKLLIKKVYESKDETVENITENDFNNILTIIKKSSGSKGIGFGAKID